jgi:hypothetical protein
MIEICVENHFSYKLPWSFSTLLYISDRSRASKKQEFWEELIAYFPLIRHESHRRRRVQELFSSCVCIRLPRLRFYRAVA